MWVYNFTAESLMIKYNDYLESIKRKGYIKRDNIKSGERAGDVIQHLVPKPVSIDGFCLFAGIEISTFKFWVRRYDNYKAEALSNELTIEEYINNKDLSGFKESDIEAIKVYQAASRVKELILEELVGGGVAGTYNPALTAMIAGLKNQEEERDENARKVGDINITINGDKIDLSD